MRSIDFLEHGGGHFHLVQDEVPVPLCDPREINFQYVLAAIQLRHVPNLAPIWPEWKSELVFERWCAAWDLPTDFQAARRLAYLVDHYRADLSNDLLITAQVDLGQLWRARKWQTLLDLVDRLPAHSWYTAAVADDEEHSKMLAEQIAKRKESDDKPENKGPALTTWTPEMAVLTSILDAVRYNSYATFAAQHGKKAGEPPTPAPRPKTPLERHLKLAEFSRRKKKHESIVARVLPKKKPE